MEFLATSRIGRVALSRNALPTIMPVLYKVDGHAITFNASGGLLAAAAGRGDVVCFEADYADASESDLWSVLVVGKLETGPRDARATAVAVAGFGADTVSLPMTIISGRATSAVLGII